MSKNLSKRHRAEKRFIAYGFISLILAATMLATIIGSMIYRSIPAYTNYSIDLEINMTEISAEDEFEDINFRGIIRSSLFSFFPEVESRSDKRKLFKLISSSASYTLRDFIIENPSYINKKFYFNFIFFLNFFCSINYKIFHNLYFSFCRNQRYHYFGKC